jgi:hypothetical protein
MLHQGNVVHDGRPRIQKQNQEDKNHEKRRRAAKLFIVSSQRGKGPDTSSPIDKSILYLISILVLLIVLDISLRIKDRHVIAVSALPSNPNSVFEPQAPTDIDLPPPLGPVSTHSKFYPVYEHRILANLRKDTNRIESRAKHILSTKPNWENFEIDQD